MAQSTELESARYPDLEIRIKRGNASRNQRTRSNSRKIDSAGQSPAKDPRHTGRTVLFSHLPSRQKYSVGTFGNSQFHHQRSLRHPADGMEKYLGLRHGHHPGRLYLAENFASARNVRPIAHFQYDCQNKKPGCAYLGVIRCLICSACEASGRHSRKDNLSSQLYLKYLYPYQVNFQ